MKPEIEPRDPGGGKADAGGAIGPTPFFRVVSLDRVKAAVKGRTIERNDAAIGEHAAKTNPERSAILVMKSLPRMTPGAMMLH